MHRVWHLLDKKAGSWQNLSVTRVNAESELAAAQHLLKPLFKIKNRL
jgi:hypothetical protein